MDLRLLFESAQVRVSEEGGEAMSGIFDEFGGSLTANVISFDRNAIPEPDTLLVRMTRGERKIADGLRKAFGGFKRVVIDVDGERHEFSADSLIRLLEGYEGARDTSRHAELFGTPERAARTLVDAMGCNRVHCDDCRARAMCDVAAECPTLDSSEYALLEWLRGDA